MCIRDRCRTVAWTPGAGRHATAHRASIAAPCRTRPRTWTAMRPANVPSPPAATTRCGARTTRTPVRKWTAAGRVSPRLSAAVAVARARPAEAAAVVQRVAAAVEAAAVAAAEGGVEMERMNMTNIKHILNIAAVAA